MLNIRQATMADKNTIIDFQIKMAWQTEQLELNSTTLEQGISAVFSDASKGIYYVAEQEDTVIASLLVTPRMERLAQRHCVVDTIRICGRSFQRTRCVQKNVSVSAGKGKEYTRTHGTQALCGKDQPASPESIPGYRHERRSLSLL